MPIEGVNRKNYPTKKFGSWERSVALDAEVAATGKSLGIEFNYDKVLTTPNSLAGQATQSSGSSCGSTLQGIFH
jgi:predicted DsbA family dithiol-disulfide isomerase